MRNFGHGFSSLRALERRSPMVTVSKLARGVSRRKRLVFQRIATMTESKRTTQHGPNCGRKFRYMRAQFHQNIHIPSHSLTFWASSTCRFRDPGNSPVTQNAPLERDAERIAEISRPIVSSFQLSQNEPSKQESFRNPSAFAQSAIPRDKNENADRVAGRRPR
jgi:hypothetical protein